MQNTPTTPDVEARVEIYKQFLKSIEAAGPPLQSAPAAPDVEALQKAYFEAQPRAYSGAQLGAYKQYLRDLEGAHLFGISRTTFRKLVRQGQIPPPIKFGNCSRWERGALLDAAARLQRHGIVAGGSGNE